MKVNFKKAEDFKSQTKMSVNFKNSREPAKDAFSIQVA